ncbi:abc transporter sub-family c-like protein 8 [Dermatophagoides farinae]|uniref:ABC-type xenobiotic transporter n=1 Tax=Dermatophagoides farinae TaxID=6954 RepID=A0A9D4P5Q9_DERFA|nr:abc transporter sub-family c-like protein 8 [Dermatophagoides farinae]
MNLNFICNNSNQQSIIHHSNHIYHLDDCFQQTFLVLPIYFCLLIYCSYQLGFYSFTTNSNHHSSSSSLHRQKCIHSIASILLAVIIICNSIIMFIIMNIRITIITVKLAALMKIFTIIVDRQRQSIDQQLLINDDSVELNNNQSFESDEHQSIISQIFSFGDDLFKLPESLSAHTLNPSIIAYLDCDHGRKKRPLIRYIFSHFYGHFLLLGLLKLFADAMNMLFPIFLNRLLLYLENNDENVPKTTRGFTFATGLLICTLLNTVCISYFNFQMSKIALKIRTILIMMTYNKLLRCRKTQLMNQFDTGQILNLANTDVERVINLVPSLFQFISLPIQLIITIYLLYTEVQLVFISAIIFIVILIPINKLICDRIKKLSEKLMLWKDKRIRLMSECLKGIRTIKFHAWESIFFTRIQSLRLNEIKYLKYRKYLDALCVYFWATTPVIISSLVFTTYVWFNGDNQLTSSKVFTTLALLGMLIMPLNALPWILNGLIESLVSLRRLNRFYRLSEQNPDEDIEWINEHENILFQCNNCSFSYSNSDEQQQQQQNFKLRDINVEIVKGKFIGITGRVGSGKSSLIKSMLNELNKINDDYGSGGSSTIRINQCCRHRGIGYVSQEPWIQDTTIRKNILFGKTFDMEFYNEIIDACELREDFQQFAHGDQTIVGNHGATLSGGQKSRITLARALYQNFSVYLADEPFASLDQQVARKIYQKCFLSILKNKSVILVTNHIEYLKDSFIIYYMDNGRITHSYLSADRLIDFDEMLDQSQQPDRNETDNEKMVVQQQQDQCEMNEELEEEREHGKIKFTVYIGYIYSIGYFLFTMIIVSICLMQITRSASDFWLSIWTSSTKQNEQQSNGSSSTMFYLFIFIAIGIGNSIITLIRAFLFAYGGVQAAINVHDQLLESLFQTSTLLFDLVSFGILINRFSSDMFNVDDALPFTLNIFLAQLSSLLIGLFVTIYGMPWISIVFIVLTIPYYMIQEYYRKTSRELKRISATTLSPIYSQLDDTIQGLTIIRSYRQNNRFKNEFYEKINIYNRVQYAINAIQQWLNLRLQMIGAIITCSVAFIAVYIHYYNRQQSINSSLIGLSLVYSLSLTNLLNGTFQAFTQTELDLISIERIRKLVEKLHDYKEENYSDDNPQIWDVSWPSEGNIRFNNVSMRYRNDLPLVLKNVSFEIGAGEHVAIIGRTGSGKSSLFQTLFRLVDIETGQIYVDGVDLKSINRKTIRSRIHIIPQDAFMFNGTIRDNLDPQHRYRDDEIWTALFDCKINILIDSLGGLDGQIDGENGMNLSIGQRHLFCLARAVLNKCKIICMDEIMANIDNETGKILDELIDTIFNQTTIVHIAHKLDSLRNYDRTIIMNDGMIC